MSNRKEHLEHLPHAEAVDRTIRLKQHNRLFALLSLAAGLIFLQGYTIAPLIPRLAEVFNVPVQEIGIIVPAYMLAYALMALFYGVLSDRFGRWSVIRISLIIFVICTALTATAQTASQMVIWRLLTGLGASGVIPLTFALIGDLFPFDQRGSKLGLVFAAMEGGMAAGSAGGAILEPFIGWRSLFIGTAVVAAFVLWRLHLYGALFDTAKVEKLPTIRQIFRGYSQILSSFRGKRTYAYVLWNGIYHSGVYTWLGLYLSQRYNMDALSIGLTILGYGIPGLLLSSLIGRAVDRWGRRWLVPAGLIMAALAGIAMIFEIPPIGTTIAVLVLSLGYDLTQPLFVGIVTDLGDSNSLGQTMGLKVFVLFTGFGIGSLIFGELLRFGFGVSLAVFGGIQLISGAIAIKLFWQEVPYRLRSKSP
ncbi:MAG: Multidrug resistance protein MdtL [Chroococcidiopsis cubana SAG 39.79]|uniref:MFS transporter n=1 Tax=Chroococcidiopsis cubana SAG 39.79 TaxID=388085 RepID=A0AB37UL75_9CYAN|nr:MFS transporter [Chroococcidiopsis cubana]MDZ4872614.1 Multidrug resistance protein MdtL [Chroococcidiopsis cubana SAG 39.79]PSB65481.1 MFS transporter [Chroococcidiopsis cubana CCALA 043]RUT12167.1 MFS transporter [Chroococcidiopsis cubana SAG 39.79]